MSEIMDVLDDLVFGPFNVISRIEGLLKCVMYGDPGVKLAIKRMDKGGHHSQAEVDALLRKYGVNTFGGTHDSKYLFFLVKKRQARWAEYVLLHAGVELHNPVFDHRNPGYAASHAPGWMPTPWSEQGKVGTQGHDDGEMPEAMRDVSLIDRALAFLDD